MLKGVLTGYISVTRILPNKQQLCSKDLTVVFQRFYICVPKMRILIPKCMMPEKKELKKDVNVIFCRANIIIYRIIINL